MRLASTLCSIALVIFWTTPGVDSEKCKKKIFHGTKGSVKSPNYPSKYPSGTKCDYVIKAPPDHYVVINFELFDVEPRFHLNNDLTDYLRVFDGREENRKQEKTYYGKIKTPFQFTSWTSRIVMQFVSDDSNRYRGFYATYEVHKNKDPSKLCRTDSLVITNGRASCAPYKSGEYTTGCEVTCDYEHTLQGNRNVTCVDSEFVDPPICKPVIDPSTLCKPENLVIKNGEPTCVPHEVLRFTTSCQVTCDEKYVLRGNDTVVCDNGVYLDPPTCRKVNRTSTMCKPVNVTIANGIANCTLHEDEARDASCSVMCDKHYVLLGDRTVTCDRTTYANPPRCIADSRQLQTCFSDINDPECLFHEDEVDREIIVYAEALKIGDTVKTRGSGRITCPTSYCSYTSTGVRAVNCWNAMKWFIAKKIYTESQAEGWKAFCYQCQNTNCGAAGRVFD